MLKLIFANLPHLPFLSLGVLRAEQNCRLSLGPEAWVGVRQD